eukprot:scaffold40388_cov86-Phaeocystis_antarctica.AAC.1
MPRARYAQGHPNHSHRTSRLWQHISNKTVRGNFTCKSSQRAALVERGRDGGLETEVLRQWPRLVSGPIQEGL